MARTDRLMQILDLLRDGARHRAGDIATRLGVSERTIYRDMDRLVAAGVPVEGTRGSGYRATGAAVLPPLALSQAEIEALTLGLAIVAEAADARLQAAAESLSARLETALPAEALPEAETWRTALSPFADTARGVGHLSRIRAAIEGRQKLHLVTRRTDGTRTDRTVRPLTLDSFGRFWTMLAWCEWRQDFRRFRLDLIEDATALPELFRDEPGRTLADYGARSA
ncbi:helix-turn-helix transcriptional regulator [Chachezhania antarctica]|uniref:helix-turn-helix transcriptional regulator n=1 Tax=Chachezhania antarctica TaxID=2340860 RepID=UPI000EAE2713|nr:YafY family protein [Chachezhania antarctica]